VKSMDGCTQELVQHVLTLTNDRLDGGSSSDNGDGGSGFDRCLRVEKVTNCEA
jgi:hypothetical protein